MGIMQTAAAIAADNTFGPQFPDYFDLTLLFEHSILSILPSAMLILGCVGYVCYYTRAPVVVDAGALLWAKLAVALLLVGIEVFTTVSWNQHMLYRSDAAVAAAALTCISHSALGIFLFVEHRHTIRSSGLLAGYLFVTAIFDAVKVRTYFTRTNLTLIGSLCIASIVLKVVLVVLGEVSKRPLIRDKTTRENMTPEATSGFWSRALFMWLNKTLFTGFNTVLRIQDLPDLEPKFQAEYLLEYFGNKLKHVNHVDRNALLRLSFSSFWSAHAAVVLPRLLYSAFNFSQPFIIQATVHRVGEEWIDNNIKIGLILATIASFFGISVTNALSDQLISRSVIQLRGALNAQLLDKSLKLTFKDAQGVAAVSLMSTDVEAILDAVRCLHSAWSGLLDLAVGFYLIARIVKQSAFLAAMPPLVAFLITFRIGIKLVSARKIWSECVQSRITSTTKFLSQLKAIKISGRSLVMFDHISSLRKAEIDQSVWMRKLWVIIHTIMVTVRFPINTPAATCAEDTIPTAVIAGGLFWSGFTSSFNAATVFSLLTVIVLIIDPLAKIPTIVPNFSAAVACSRRIQEFLLLKEQRDRRIIGSSRSSEISCGREKYEEATSMAALPNHVGHFDEVFPADCAVALQNVTLTHGDDRQPKVKNASFSIRKGHMSFVAGPTGSGKSSLLLSIIGELDPVVGSVYVHDPCIAYCSQTPFIQNTSIREVITGGRKFDLPWYCKIVRACELQEDIARLENGDQTSAGSEGNRLSGGQKQRLAMAQLAYAGVETVVLDNPFSAVDFQTARKVFANLFAKDTGILRQMNTTIIMATQTMEFLEAGDQIHVLNGQGDVRTCKSLSAFVELSASIPDMSLIGRSRDEEQYASDSSSASSSSAESFEDEPNLPEAFLGKDITDLDTDARKSGDLQAYRFLFHVIPLSASVIYFIFVALALVSEKFLEIYVRIWVDKAPADKARFVGLPAILVVFAIFHTAWYWHFYSRVVPTLALNLHEKLLDTIVRADLTFLTSKDNGAILNRFGQDMSFVNVQLQRSLLPATSCPVSILLSLGIIASGASFTALIIPFFFAVIYAIMFYYLKTSRQMRHLDLEGQTPLYTHFTETTTGLRHIRSLGRQHQVLRAGLEKLNTSQKPYYYMMTIQQWLVLMLNLLVLVIAIFLQTLALYVRTGTSRGATGLALLNIVGFAKHLQLCVISWAGFETSIGVIARLKALMEQTPLEDTPPPLESLPPNWPTHGELQLSEVSLSYSTRDKAAAPVLKDISCNIFAGARVALEGRTGSGKSSLILALLNLIDRTGDIKLDGIDPRTIHPDILRSRITTIAQDPVRLPGTVRDNLIPPDLIELARTTPITDEDIAEILHELCIWDYIVANGGLDTQYEDMSFSDGQRQLVALAAAVIHNRVTGTRLVIMDEATSHLDYTTDNTVQAYLATIFQPSTVVCVTHRRNGFPKPDYSLRLVSGALDTFVCHTVRANQITSGLDAYERRAWRQ